jgi:hypothetical protein
MTNSVMSSWQPAVRGIWRLLYPLSFVAALVAIAIWWFSFVQAKHYETLTKQQNVAIDTLNKDIDAAMKDNQYVRYAAAKQVVQKNPATWWWDRLSRIMSVFATLQQLGWWSTVRFSDFAVDFSSLHLKGTVSDLVLIYGKWWVIDQFNALDFLQDISITDYKRSNDGYAFTLVAKVVLQNAWR